MNKSIIALILSVFITSCSNTRIQSEAPPFLNTFEDLRPTIGSFDLIKDHNMISSVDLITLKDWPTRDSLGFTVTNGTVMLDATWIAVDKVYKNVEGWKHEEFLNLFDKYKERRYTSCFCSAKYVVAAVFYAPSDSFRDTFNSSENTRVGIALFDESHDSVLISDYPNGEKTFRFSVGHSADSRTPQFIAKLMEMLGEEYEFMQR